MSNKAPLVLIILDGWGYSEQTMHNAINAANTPHWDSWWQTCPHTLLNASGVFVGLPDLQMGNSEVGHMHIGAGRMVPQDFTRINNAIADGSFMQNTLFLKLIDDLKQNNQALHIMGLLSDGGVHSHEQHLFAFLSLCADKKVTNVHLHLFLDGRDTSPQSAQDSLARLQACIAHYPAATIDSICGRYYAMDRDKRWSRVEPVYQLLTTAKSQLHFQSAEDAIAHFYQQGISDEFIPPSRIGAGCAIQDDDCVFFFNFRADRARQLTQALTADAFTGFNRQKKPTIRTFLTMTSYSKELLTDCAFPNITLQNTLGEVIAQHGLRQLRLAETEKYAHVTFFLNGGSELIFPNETRILINSPNVATYDLQPEMSAIELTQTLVRVIEEQTYDVIICNYANADMVGHTGNFPATVRAIECLDQALGAVWDALKPLNGQLLITADHGNAEAMFDDATKQAHTAHTNQPVPLLYVGNNKWRMTATNGSLVDIAPTVLALLHITPPSEMTGEALLTEEQS